MTTRTDVRRIELEFDMYICLCKGITEKQLKDALHLSAGNKADTLKRLGVGGDCGTCLQLALEKIVDSAPPQVARNRPQITPSVRK